MPKTDRFTFTLPEDLREKLLAYADQKRTRAAQILRDYIAKLPAPKR